MDTLQIRLQEGSAHVGIVGLGYAGLPMAVAIAASGLQVTGLDIDRRKVGLVNAGKSPVNSVADADVGRLVEAGRLRASADPAVLRELDAAIICVPTPITEEKEPDLSAVIAASRDIGRHLHRGMLVALQSTSYPGTTREVVLPELAKSGLMVGEDFHLVFAPERIDPGNKTYGVENTPKLVGGITPRCTEMGALLFRRFIQKVIPVSSPEVAEMSKLVENTFRFINISFANEMALLCDRLGISVWEVLDAAASKPFAFMPHYPGPGVGGHCIPVVPFYLESVARRHGMVAGLIEVAGRVNDGMPAFVVEKLEREMADIGGTRRQAPRVLAVGVTYKPDVADLRESAALRVIQLLLRRGFDVSYHDPLIDQVEVGGVVLRSQPLDPGVVAGADAVVLLTPHSTLDYQVLLDRAKLILDTSNALRSRPSETTRVVPL